MSGRRRIAARAAQHARLSRHHAHDRIVDPVGDVAVVDQGVRGDAGEPLARLVSRR